MWLLGSILILCSFPSFLVGSDNQLKGWLHRVESLPGDIWAQTTAYTFAIKDPYRNAPGGIKIRLAEINKSKWPAHVWNAVPGLELGSPLPKWPPLSLLIQYVWPTLWRSPILFSLQGIPWGMPLISSWEGPLWLQRAESIQTKQWESPDLMLAGRLL